MFYVEAAVAFAIWLAYGATQARRGIHLLAVANQVPANRKLLLAFAWLGGGLVALGGAFALILLGHGLTPEGFTIWAFLLVVAAGLVLVNGQTRATSLLASFAKLGRTDLAETTDPPATSSSTNPQATL